MYADFIQKQDTPELEENLKKITVFYTELYFKILLSRYAEIKLAIYSTRLQQDEFPFQRILALFCMINLQQDETQTQERINASILEAVDLLKNNESTKDFMNKLVKDLNENNITDLQAEFAGATRNAEIRDTISLALFVALNEYFCSPNTSTSQE
jgi:hypothetical protein